MTPGTLADLLLVIAVACVYLDARQRTKATEERERVVDAAIAERDEALQAGARVSEKLAGWR